LKGGQSLTKIYLDAGHGGHDSGAIGFGLYEKNLNLAIAKKIEAILKASYKNIEILQTRTTDVFLELSERTNKANQWGADIFLSIHCNAHTNTAVKGFESYIYPNTGPQTIALQNVMHQEITRHFSDVNGVVDRGKKTANFHVLRESNMAAILTENFYLSNSNDTTLLKQDSFLNNLAQGHVNGLEKFFGLEKIEKPVPAVLYEVIAGTFEVKENADNLTKKLTADGYECYVRRKD
jgi:N-acetylmuramoyl-L-alanine amidase